jgi:hypothetical protein
MDHSSLQKVLKLSSGFTVSVRPYPPYYIDFITDAFPFANPVKRKIRLASGDTYEEDYIVPDKLPEDASEEELALYLRHKQVQAHNERATALRERAKRDYLLANCVSIVDGPYDVDSVEWVQQLEASIEDFQAPTHPGKRMLAFMKSQVLRTTSDFTNVIQTSLYMEETMQGILTALQGFRDEVERPTSPSGTSRKVRKRH